MWGEGKATVQWRTGDASFLLLFSIEVTMSRRKFASNYSLREFLPPLVAEIFSSFFLFYLKKDRGNEQSTTNHGSTFMKVYDTATLMISYWSNIVALVSFNSLWCIFFFDRKLICSPYIQDNFASAFIVWFYYKNISEKLRFSKWSYAIVEGYRDICLFLTEGDWTTELVC